MDIIDGFMVNCRFVDHSDVGHICLWIMDLFGIIIHYHLYVVAIVIYLCPLGIATMITNKLYIFRCCRCITT